MTITLQTIITIGSTILTWVMGKKYLLPQLIKLWEWIKEKKKENDNHKLNATKELKEIEEKSNDVYENQITFLMQQVQQLENELLEYQKQLEVFRKKILELNNSLYHKSLIIGKLRQYCCKNEDCKFRIYCDDEFCKLSTTEN